MTNVPYVKSGSSIRSNVEDDVLRINPTVATAAEMGVIAVAVVFGVVVELLL